MRLIGLDVGEKRTGVSRVDTSVKIAVPFGVIEMNNTKFTEIRRVADFYNATVIIVGLPRNTSGLETAQSKFVRDFVAELRNKHEKFKIIFQDETLTSVEAEKRLKARGRSYEKADIDSEAATIILQDFIDFCINKSRTTGVAIEEVISSTAQSFEKAFQRSSNLDFASFDSHGSIKIPKSPTQNLKTSKPETSNTTKSLAVKSTPKATPATVIKPVSKSPSAPPTKSALKSSPKSVPSTKPKESKVSSIPLIKSRKNPKPKNSLKTKLSVISNKVTKKLASTKASAKITINSKIHPNSVKTNQKPTRNLPKFAIKLPKSVKIRHIIIGISVFIPLSIAFFAFLWYNGNISAISSKPSCEKYTAACVKSDFKIDIGDTADTIAANLKSAGIIKNKSAFKLFLKLNRHGGNFKAGLHPLNSAMSAAEIVAELEKTNSASVFSFTILPGETIFDIKNKLLKAGYGTIEVTEAFKKHYDHPILSEKPKDASLEGYLFAETYEFFKDESIENIIKRLLDETNKFVNQNDLRTKYAARGLTLHQGLTIASIIQKETKTDHQIVAQIFEKRFKNNEKLGSDVTVSYAVTLVDPTRQVYKNNAEKLEIDSPYNTRKFTGLPPTPISAPGADSLNAVANPSNTDYLYFLTGDDGKMYYSKTDAEHNYNIRQFCQKLCAAGL